MLRGLCASCRATSKNGYCRRCAASPAIPGRPAPRLCRGEPRGTLRVRVGDYRIIYRVDDRDGKVLVLDIAHRSTAYR